MNPEKNKSSESNCVQHKSNS